MIKMVKIDKDIEAIEKERQAYEADPDGFDEENKDSDEESEEEREVEVLEFALNDDEIDEFIEKLNELKESKGSFDFEIDDENELHVSYESGDGE